MLEIKWRVGLPLGQVRQDIPFTEESTGQGQSGPPRKGRIRGGLQRQKEET